jgi:hypothetical protein
VRVRERERERELTSILEVLIVELLGGVVVVLAGVIAVVL